MERGTRGETTFSNQPHLLGEDILPPTTENTQRVILGRTSDGSVKDFLRSMKNQSRGKDGGDPLRQPLAREPERANATSRQAGHEGPCAVLDLEAKGADRSVQMATEKMGEALVQPYASIREKSHRSPLFPTRGTRQIDSGS